MPKYKHRVYTGNCASHQFRVKFSREVHAWKFHIIWLWSEFRVKFVFYIDMMLNWWISSKVLTIIWHFMYINISSRSQNVADFCKIIIHKLSFLYYKREFPMLAQRRPITNEPRSPLHESKYLCTLTKHCSH